MADKRRSATEIFEFLEQVGLIWQLHPERSFGSMIYSITRNPTELPVLKDKDIIQRLLKEDKNDRL
jgi:hypothetical protein